MRQSGEWLSDISMRTRSLSTLLWALAAMGHASTHPPAHSAMCSSNPTPASSSSSHPASVTATVSQAATAAGSMSADGVSRAGKEWEWERERERAGSDSGGGREGAQHPLIFREIESAIISDPSEQAALAERGGGGSGEEARAGEGGVRGGQVLHKSAVLRKRVMQMLVRRCVREGCQCWRW